jgi:hypothetical protein
MRIKFTGYMYFAETPDDRGSVDVWIENSIHHWSEMDGSLEGLDITWEEVEDNAFNTNS